MANRQPNEALATGKAGTYTGTPPSIGITEFGDEQMAKEHAETSQEEHDQANRDLYGIEDYVIDETDDFLEESFRLLDEAIQDVEEKEAYELASFVNPEYISSKKFRIMFLRAERFDIPKTAVRIVKYWDRKVQIFGTDYAFRPLSILDLPAQDEVALGCAGLSLLNARDSVGRALLFCYRKYWDHRPESRDSMIRLLWILVHTAVEDNELVQVNGVQLLMANDMSSQAGTSEMYKATPSTSHYDPSLHQWLWYDAQVLPFRCGGIHHFTPQSDLLTFIYNRSGLFFMGRNFRLLYRRYNGTKAENMARIEEYGLTSSMVPTELGGDMVLDNSAWIQARMLRDMHLAMEQQAKST
mmetsp:Transcript_19088/g.25052  ORF Transcript_19088/g.25052 Transcript_19088/m.25052 type:complete len:355 (+) Transcript_19088:30-1094(+)